MQKTELQLLTTLLALPSYFGEEGLVRAWLLEYATSLAYEVTTDPKGNVYMTKGHIGPGEFYPCVAAHMDTVFSDHVELVQQNLRKRIVFRSGKLIAYHPLTQQRTGLGGDDLAGVFICLQMLAYFPVLKAAFFVEEEFGCQGSAVADPHFFADVGYVVQFDAPSANRYTEFLGGKRIYDDVFDALVHPILETHGVTNYSDDPYTDVLQLSEKFQFSCANLPTGYYKWHTNDEYVKVKDVDHGILLGQAFITRLGLCHYGLEVPRYCPGCGHYLISTVAPYDKCDFCAS